MRLASGSQTVADARPTPPTETSATVRGTVCELRWGPNGRVHSLVLSDQTVLQLPPAAVEQLADKPTAGASLEATGTVRANRPGEALADRELPRLRVTGRTLTIALPGHEAAARLTISTHPDQLTTILLNLLNNARKHGAPGRCGWRARRAQAPPSAWPTRWPCRWGPTWLHLTAAWYQADPMAPGTGLGLGIAGRLAQGLGVRLDFTEIGPQLCTTVGCSAPDLAT